MKIVDDVEYWDIRETYMHLNMTRATFYRSVKEKLHVYFFEGRSKPWYKRSEVVALAQGKLEERPHIVLRGLLKNWTHYAQELGLPVETINCMVEIGVSLAPELCTWLGVIPESTFIKRSRVSFLDTTPICYWETYYSRVLVSQFIDSIKHEPDFDLVAALQEQRGITIKRAKERHIAREASLFEQEILQLRRPEPVLQLQRAAYSELGRLVLYSDMSLLGSWFEPELSYDVDH